MPSVSAAALGASGHPVVLEVEERNSKILLPPQATASRSQVTAGELNSPHIRCFGVTENQRATSGKKTNLAEMEEESMELLSFVNCPHTLPKWSFLA